jgi:LPXTG-motif cell wall-anchored protein
MSRDLIKIQKDVMMNRLLVFFIFFIIFIPQSQAETIPPNQWKFNEDYFTVYGQPEMIVSIIGSPEYDRDESTTILIQIMNQGKILGFESEDEPADANEIALSKIEQQYEYGVTTAVGVIATLFADEAPVDIKSQSQSAGTIVSGQISEPLQFEIKVWENAEAGTYPLRLKLTYQYQKDVQVEGDSTTNEIDYNFLYKEINESYVLDFSIKEQADFEVTQVSSKLLPGSKGILSITFRNTGEETASKSTARLRLSDPLSSTDFTAFLGDMEPGDEVLAMFNIEVDEDATVKTYSVKTEIEYDDAEGKIVISDTIYVPVPVYEEPDSGGIFQNLFFIGGLVLILAGLVYLYQKRKGGKGSE